MATFRWTLDNTVSGTQVIGDPVGWKEIELQLARHLDYHGVFSEFTVPMKFTCNRGAIVGGKEYIDNIYETQGVDALVEILIEYKCDTPDPFTTLFNGKLNLTEYRTGVDGTVGEFTEVSLERDDITQTIINQADTKINLNELFTLKGSAMNAYTNAPFALPIRSQTITLDSEDNGGVFSDLNLFDGVVRPQFITGAAEQLIFQPNLPVVEDDLTTIIENPDFHDKNAVSSLVRNTLGEFYDSKENKIIQWPQTFTVSWDIAGNYFDTIPIIQTRTLATQLSLHIIYGTDLVDAQAQGNIIAIGNIPGYTTALLNFTVPYAFLGSQAITMQQGWKMWLFWQTTGGTGYVVTTGAGPHTIGFTFAYTRSEVHLNVDSTQPTVNRESFAIYESWARVSESLTDQVAFAFKSDFYGRTDSQPNAGGAPTYLVEGCGSFNFIVSGLSLRSYKYLSKITPLPDWSTLNELFETCNAIHNIGLGVELHGGVDVIRVEDKAYFYDSTEIIELNNVPEIQYYADPERFINEFEIGFAEWKSEGLGGFSGLDEINTQHLYHLPLTTIKNRLTALSPYLTAGYVIEIMKRLDTENKLDTKYDSNMFVMNVVKLLGVFVSARAEDFAGGSGFDNVPTRHNRRLTPKHNFLRWLNVLGAGIEKVAGNTIDFAQGEDNYDIFNTMNSVGCPGDYTGNILDEDGDIAWDDANARLNSPLWIPEIYEFDFPLTFDQYETIRSSPRGYIAFSDGTTNHIHGFILEIKFKLAGGMTHFKLLRRYTT